MILLNAVDTYFTIKLVGPIVILSALVLILLGIIISGCIDHIRNKIKIKYIESLGFKRELESVSAFGGVSHYWYVKRNSEGLIEDYIRESTLKRSKLKNIKNKINGGRLLND